MSLKLAIAKLSAAAAGVALLQGGAVRMAEPMNTQAPDYTTNIDGKLIAVDPVTGARYIKTRERIIPEERRRRIVERTIECQPVVPGAAAMPAGVVQAYADPVECPPLQQIAYMPAPLPPLPRFRVAAVSPARRSSAAALAAVSAAASSAVSSVAAVRPRAPSRSRQPPAPAAVRAPAGSSSISTIRPRRPRRPVR
ncbi:hypothetical protein [Porphyrobacter sp. LM 6]|uniref:hypothetical protein n=1 Tax=Porphyrobacter sp. LM 6 TaxID=1896196 RepID=UPI0012370A6E|nr:hypothetical protein [Porphyrobacter sp. LM 6]